MDSLFQSFNATISVANFAELSACVISWLEEYCKPQVSMESVRVSHSLGVVGGRAHILGTVYSAPDRKG